MSAIEIQLLLDRLEALLVESRSFLFTSNIIVDRERCFEIINQMRISIPEEVKKAQRVHRERDRIIAQSNEEAERIIALANEQAMQRVSEHEIIRLAEEKGRVIVERAQREAQEIRSGADEYAQQVLQSLEAMLNDQLTTVKNGIATLENSAQQPR